MSGDSTSTKGRVIGIGGVFFKSSDKGRLDAWYATNLGMDSGPAGFAFRWRPHDGPQVEHQTIWCVFPQESNYFGPGAAPFMINYIVENLDALLADLTANGVAIDPRREDNEYGRFAWIFDPDGNKIELWEPRKPDAA